MKNKFKEAQKEAKRQIKERTYRRDAEGRVIIPMNVKSDDNFLSEFSENDTPIIASEVADFIETSTCEVHPNEELTLQIHSDCIDEEEQQLYSNAIREYYMQRYIANEREIRRNRWIVLLLGLAGVLVLLAQIIYDHAVGNAIWAEVIDIVAWVLLWEATDIGLLGTRNLRIQKKRCLSYLSMKIEYLKPSTP